LDFKPVGLHYYYYYYFGKNRSRKFVYQGNRVKVTGAKGMSVSSSLVVGLRLKGNAVVVCVGNEI